MPHETTSYFDKYRKGFGRLFDVNMADSLASLKSQKDDADTLGDHSDCLYNLHSEYGRNLGKLLCTANRSDLVSRPTEFSSVLSICC